MKRVRGAGQMQERCLKYLARLEGSAGRGILACRRLKIAQIRRAASNSVQAQLARCVRRQIKCIALSCREVSVWITQKRGGRNTVPNTSAKTAATQASDPEEPKSTAPRCMGGPLLEVRTEATAALDHKYAGTWQQHNSCGVLVTRTRTRQRWQRWQLRRRHQQRERKLYRKWSTANIIPVWLCFKIRVQGAGVSDCLWFSACGASGLCQAWC